MKDFISKGTEFARDLELDVNRPGYDYLAATTRIYLDEEVNETLSACIEQDDAEIIDGAGDIAFIALNLIYKWGIQKKMNHLQATHLIYEVMHRIGDANLSKKQSDGSVKRNEEGKVLKPDNFVAPIYDDIIQGDLECLEKYNKRKSYNIFSEYTPPVGTRFVAFYQDGRGTLFAKHHSEGVYTIYGRQTNKVDLEFFEQCHYWIELPKHFILWEEKGII